MAVSEAIGASRLDRTVRVRAPVIVPVFALCYVPLVFAGYALKEDLSSLTIIWPAAGVLLAVLFFSPSRLWPALAITAVACEVAIGFAQSHSFSLIFPLANLTDGVVGALLTRQFVPDPGSPRLRQVAAFVGTSAIGAASGALVGAWGAVHALATAPYWHQWQLWWAGNWLGSLTLAPVALTWAVRLLTPARSVKSLRFWELLGFCVLLIALTAWIFRQPADLDASIISVPYTLVILLAVAAFRLPPRWVTSLCAGTILIAAAFSAYHLGPFSAIDNPLTRVLSLQLFLAMAALGTFMLSTALLEMSRLLGTLERSDDRYRSFVRHSSEAIWRIELRKPLPITLPAAEQMKWLRQHAYVGECSKTYESLHARFAPSDAPIDRWQGEIPWSAVLLRNFERAMANGYVTQDLPVALRDPNGVEYWSANFHGVVEDGHLLRIWGVARNETELIRANEALEREREQLAETTRTLQNLMDASPLAVVLIDRSLRIRLWNSSAEALFGWKSEEVLGEIVPFVPPDELPLLRPEREDRQYGVERKRLRRDGSSVIINLWTTPMHDATGAIVGQLGVMADMTEHRRHQKQTQQAQKLEALGTLAAGIAHDFNNILTMMMGYLSLARETLGPEHAVSADLLEMEKAARRAANLVKQILIFSRPQEQPLQPLDLAAVIEEGLTLLRATLPRSIDIQSDIESGEAPILGDAAQIQQLLVNLGINAAQAMSDQRGIIRVDLHRVNVDAHTAAESIGLHEGESVRVSFTDSGCGMDGATLERIFDPFFTTKPAGKGTGLGLSVVRGIMMSHRGAVTAQSELGKGTAFNLYFPLATDGATAPAGRQEDTHVGHGERILCVDDEPALADLAARLLARAGYQAEAYTDAGDALSHFAARPEVFDLVITDLSMPGTSGLELAERVLEIRPDIPVVIASGYISAQDEARARAIGVRAVIGKPATVREVCANIPPLLRGGPLSFGPHLADAAPTT
jgi:PAS domain S-box-containing protein